MKKNKIIYWTSTGFIFLFEGLMPAIFGNTDMARQGVAHLGYPDYFRVMLNIFKIAGALVLIVPAFSMRIKEWAYAGFTFNFISAAVSHAAVDGFGTETLFPLLILLIHLVSYYYYHLLLKNGRSAL